MHPQVKRPYNLILIYIKGCWPDKNYALQLKVNNIFKRNYE